VTVDVAWTEHAPDCSCVPTWPPLTRPEVLTLQQIARGMSYSDVAKQQGVAMDTIKGRMKRIYRKLGAANAPHAVSIGIGMKLIFAEQPQGADA
jgi:DNA-binding CsgD family transcriptional regulator